MTDNIRIRYKILTKTDDWLSILKCSGIEQCAEIFLLGKVNRLTSDVNNRAQDQRRKNERCSQLILRRNPSAR